MAFQVEVAAPGADRLGECPLWDEREMMLWWVDSRWPAAKRLDPSSGAVVDGAVRDISHSRGIGYPVWCKGASPITGKWRIETVAINVPVAICGIEVKPGDLVVADEVGVCFVPHARAADVLAVVQRILKYEEDRLRQIAAGVPVPDLAKAPRK